MSTVNCQLFRFYKVAFFVLTIVLFLFVSGKMTTRAVDQSRSNDYFAGAWPAQVSSATSSSFTIYIGDNLSGVTNPVKAAYFVVSGVYTGGGYLELKIDSDAATAKTYSLPSVTNPTPFEIIYQDDTNKINPASAGSYSYTLNFTPSTIVISGLGAKIEITYQFAQASCPDGSPTNEKVKTNDYFAGAWPAQVSSATSSSFTIYIGDNLNGVTNPVKAAYFLVSGVYTGGGSLELKIDSDAATAKTYSLPSVTNPTPFEIIYQDDTNKINPASAGSYSYTLNFTPSTIVISGLGAKAAVSYRYKPPACGGGYPAHGDLTSAVFDTTATSAGPAYNSIMWQGSLGGPSQNQGKVRLQLAASDSDAGPWSYVGSSCVGGASDWYEAASNTPVEIGCFSQFNNKRYFRYKIEICSDDCVTGGNYTPQVDEVVVNWSP